MCDDHADLWQESHPVARKEHKCCECARTIDKGQRHWRVDSLFDGRWERYRFCHICEAHWEIFRQENEGCITPYGLSEIEHYGDIQDKFVILNSSSAECMKEDFYEC